MADPMSNIPLIIQPIRWTLFIKNRIFQREKFVECFIGCFWKEQSGTSARKDVAEFVMRTSWMGLLSGTEFTVMIQLFAGGKFFSLSLYRSIVLNFNYGKFWSSLLNGCILFFCCIWHLEKYSQDRCKHLFLFFFLLVCNLVSFYFSVFINEKVPFTKKTY